MAKNPNGIKIERSYITQKDNWNNNTLKVVFTAELMDKEGIMLGTCIMTHNCNPSKRMAISMVYHIGNDMRSELKKALDKAVYFDDAAWYFLNLVTTIVPEYKFI